MHYGLVGKNAQKILKIGTAHRHEAWGPPGGLFEIDQEVGTLRGLFGNSGISRPTCVRRMESLLTGSVRAVASVAARFAHAGSETPLRATSSKSQPPHLVYDWYIYCLQNLSSDHLLSGVNRRIVRKGGCVKF